MIDKTVASNRRKFRSSRLNQYNYHLLFHAFLASFLQSADRMSMASSSRMLECPFWITAWLSLPLHWTTTKLETVKGSTF